MKKLLLAFILAGSLLACDNAADSEQRIKDSLDSITKIQKESIDEAAQDAKKNLEQQNDSLDKKIDSIGEKIDSANKTQ